MNNPKADNQLNLALDATIEERGKSMDLDVGYNEADRKWDLIIKYSGDIDTLKEYTDDITILLGGYAVVRISQDRIDEFLRVPQIEYVEKPKRLFFSLYQAQAVSGINAVKVSPLNLSGRGILVACIDSGLDYYHRDFRNPDGSTRLISLWDQTITGNPPQGYFLGTEFTKEQINENLFDAANGNSIVGAGLETIVDRTNILSRDNSGHGTAVLGIAAGNGFDSGGIYEGVAPESDLLVVKLGNPLPDSFPRTSELIQAIDYCVRKGIERNQPLVINLSFGSSYGSREGNSLLESYVDQVAGLGRSVICTGMGNEGRAAGHTAVQLASRETVDIELTVGAYQPAFSLQVWKDYTDEVGIEIISPTGESVQIVSRTAESVQQRAYRYTIGSTRLLFYYGLPSPYSLAQEFYVEFLPEEMYVDGGIWVFRITAGTVVNGSMDFYLPGGGTLNEDTRFLTPSPERTLTIPAAAENVIAVGAYDARLNAYANFSGRGYTRSTNQVKPDLAAPGVGITTTKIGGGYEAVTGTSFATPFVTGAAALMMEWGIVKGNYEYLYGDAVKANLRKGARRLAGIEKWPNPELGYGVLDLINSIPF